MVQKIIDSKEKLLKLNPIPLIQCLSDCDLGSKLFVLSVNAGMAAKRRLAHLGIVPGVKIIKKKSAPFRGPIEIIVRGTSLVLGRGLASKIIVNCGDSCNT
jgi:Fe2+ transport system protein FeoA